MHKMLPNTQLKRFTVFVVLISIFFMGYVVYISGGTSAVYTHLMYIPIIIAAFYFDIKGAATAALLSGLVLGPWMPLNVYEDISQKPVSWLFRMIMFLVIGIISALLFKSIKNLKNKEIKESFLNPNTGLPNDKQLLFDLKDMINKKFEFSLIGFRIMNMDDINQYASHEIGIKTILKAIEIFTGWVNTTVYSIYTNEFAAIIPSRDNQNSYSIGMEFLNQIKEPLSVDRFKIQLIIKGSIAIPSLKDENANDLIKKIDIALGSKTNESGLVIYDSSLEQKNKEKYELTVSLFNAIKNNEFHIVYQPMVSLNDNRVIGTEALLRWNHGTKGQISPEIFIKLAEEIGLINEITKWVIENVIDQIKKWQSEGISVKVAINISSKDLRNHAVIDHLKTSLEKSGLEPTMIELELTERSVLNSNNIRQYLDDLREYGIKISLDDFGTGYNSLVDLIQIPIDCLKIDKIFIDNITDNANRIIIENVIDFAHNTGKKVISEGVETQKQLNILKNMGCDYIQGYVFSKPLPPEKIKEMYLLNA